jgi:UPF0176 protein
MKDYLILLYYCYTKIEDPEAFRKAHYLYCIENNLLGRIIVASEGINGTISGLKSDCEKYMAELLADSRFAHTEFKTEPYETHAFQKLNVRVKDEIVHSGLKHINPNEKTGEYLEPEAFKKMKDQEDVVVVDVRSNYENTVGKFKNAIAFDIDNFRDFPEKAQELEKYKRKRLSPIAQGASNVKRPAPISWKKDLKMCINSTEASSSMGLKPVVKILRANATCSITGLWQMSTRSIQQ